MKKTLCAFVLLLIAGVLSAAVRTPEEAAMVAAQFTNTMSVANGVQRAPRTAASMRLAHTRNQRQSEQPAFYVFNQADNSGFVIVSAEDRAVDVLGYSDKGAFDTTRVNPNMKWWLSRLTEEISLLAKSTTFVKEDKQATYTAIAPLLGDIEWDQEAPYYNQCPIDKYDNKRSYTGCVATAAAQIMRKWCYPTQGIGSKTYTWYNCTSVNKAGECTYKTTNLTADFENTEYDWANMLTSYSGSYTTAQGNAVATLMYHCGVACEMDYSSEGSGSWTDDMGYGMREYFGYKIGKFISTCESKSDYETGKGTSTVLSDCEFGLTQTQFANYMHIELEAGRPVLMGGETGDDPEEDGGHEFVCDGRDTKGYFHINWGWSGEDNGYFAISSLDPTDGTKDHWNFSYLIDAIIGIEPASLDTVDVTGITISQDTLTLDINQTFQLTASVQPKNATIRKYSWSTMDAAIATVDAGLVKGIATGTTTIVVTSEDGGFTDSCKVTVTTNTYVPKDYVLVTKSSELTDGQYLIVYVAGKVAMNGAVDEAGNTISVTIKNNKIEATDDIDAASFILTASKGYLQGMNGNYIGWASAKKNGLTCSSSVMKNTISISNNEADIVAATSGAYLRYNKADDQQRFRYYKSTSYSDQQPIALFKKEGGTTPTPIKVDTIFVTCSEAAEVASTLSNNKPTSTFYAVTGYITNIVGSVSNNQQTFWMDDAKGSTKTFEAYKANLPTGVSAFTTGMKVRVYGNILNYSSTYEIKNGNVEIIDEKGTDILAPEMQQNALKRIENGQVIIIRDGVRYNIMGQQL